MRQAYSLLATLHCKALEEAFGSLDGKQLNLLDVHNRQLRKAIKTGIPLHCVEADARFHEVILGAANNRFLIDCIDKINVHILRMEYIRFKSSSWEVSSANDHARIIDALRRGDKASAIDEMKQNWLSFAE
jgi:DNA-binding GntR family transcriptional regulator